MLGRGRVAFSGGICRGRSNFLSQFLIAAATGSGARHPPYFPFIVEESARCGSSS